MTPTTSLVGNRAGIEDPDVRGGDEMAAVWIGVRDGLTHVDEKEYCRFRDSAVLKTSGQDEAASGMKKVYGKARCSKGVESDDREEYIAR
jgi:hypothetical protein